MRDDIRPNSDGNVDDQKVSSDLFYPNGFLEKMGRKLHIHLTNMKF